MATAVNLVLVCATMPKRSRSVWTQLAAFYERNGYARLLVPERRAAQKQKYKKGDEIRLVAFSPEEVASLSHLIEKAGLFPGKPFEKGNRFVVPIYGREQVARFLRMISS